MVTVVDLCGSGYWLQPSLQPLCALAVGKVNKKKRATKVLRSAGILNFPQDFFEHCQNQSSDIEFGGNDVLQVCIRTRGLA